MHLIVTENIFTFYEIWINNILFKYVLITSLRYSNVNWVYGAIMVVESW